MAMGIIVKPNPYFRPGTWVEGTDAGWQKAEVEQVDNRLKVIRTVGIILADRLIRPFIMRPMTHGLDK